MIIVFNWFHIFERVHQTFNESFISPVPSLIPLSFSDHWYQVFLTLPDTLILPSSAQWSWLLIFSQSTIIMAHSSLHSSHVPRSGNFTLCQNFLMHGFVLFFQTGLMLPNHRDLKLTMSLRISYNSWSCCLCHSSAGTQWWGQNPELHTC